MSGNADWGERDCALGDEGDVEFFACAARNFLHHFIIAVADEAFHEVVGECAVKVELVPVLFVHVPCAGDFGMSVAQFYGVVGLALEYEPFGVLQVNHRKDAPSDAKSKGGFVEGEVLGGKGEGEAVCSYAFDVYGEIEGEVFKVIRVFKVLDDLKTSQS